MVENINRFMRVQRKLMQELGRQPTPEEISKILEIEPDKAREIIKISQQPASLDTPVGDEEDSYLGDFIYDITAAHILGIKLDLANVQKYIKSFGLVATDIDNNKTSARDMGKLLELIYTRKVASEALTRELLDFMEDTDTENRLPADIPKNVAVYHKTGDAIGLIHDVGIINREGDPFILAVLTSDITDEGEAKKVIGKIAKFIYEQKH
jgi:hypothetical protein